MFIFVDIPDENGENSIVFTRFYKIYGNMSGTLCTIGIVLINFTFNLHIYFIIDKFSPAHFALATILDSFGSLLISIFKGSIEITEFIGRFILCLFLIFTGLIYNEIIILNFCGLQKDTKLFLENESKTDILQTKMNENDLEITKQEGMSNAVNLKDLSDDEQNESFNSSIISF